MSGTFHRVGRLRYGYAPQQVEDFFGRARRDYDTAIVDGDVGVVALADDPTSFDRAAASLTSREIRSIGFDLVRGGYDVEAVDAALDRLEDAFSAREREQVIATRGEDGWLETVASAADLLRGRLGRPERERFAPAEGREQGYAIEDVDALCDRLRGYFDDGEAMSVDDVRRAVFATRRGAQAYREAQVDAFLDRVVEVMAAVE